MCRTNEICGHSNTWTHKNRDQETNKKKNGKLKDSAWPPKWMRDDKILFSGDLFKRLKLANVNRKHQTNTSILLDKRMYLSYLWTCSTDRLDRSIPIEVTYIYRFSSFYAGSRRQTRILLAYLALANRECSLLFIATVMFACRHVM